MLWKQIFLLPKLLFRASLSHDLHIYIFNSIHSAWFHWLIVSFTTRYWKARCSVRSPPPSAERASKRRRRRFTAMQKQKAAGSPSHPHNLVHSPTHSFTYNINNYTRNVTDRREEINHTSLLCWVTYLTKVLHRSV